MVTVSNWAELMGLDMMRFRVSSVAPAIPAPVVIPPVGPVAMLKPVPRAATLPCAAYGNDTVCHIFYIGALR